MVDVSKEKETNKFKIKYKYIPVNKEIENDESCEKILKEYEEITKSKLKKVLAFVNEDNKLDVTTNTCRTGESNMGNFICDVIRLDLDCDCVK